LAAAAELAIPSAAAAAAAALKKVVASVYTAAYDVFCSSSMMNATGYPCSLRTNIAGVAWSNFKTGINTKELTTIQDQMLIIVILNASNSADEGGAVISSRVIFPE
jgi:hypothetical protein